MEQKTTPGFGQGYLVQKISLLGKKQWAVGRWKKKPAKNPKFGMVKNKKLWFKKKIAPWGIGPEGGKEKKSEKYTPLNPFFLLMKKSESILLRDW